MKINTITCHRVYNYGATLQAYALQHYLETLGHEVEIIDYRPWYLCGRYNPLWYNKKAKSKRADLIKAFPPIKYILLPYLALRRGMFKTYGRKHSFDEFNDKYYHLTPRTYKSYAELQDDPPAADEYIAGSDQIWNTHMENGKDGAFYLDFGQKGVRRISYAASLATSEIEQGWEMFVKENVSQLDNVSVREATGVTLLHKLGIENVCQVVDPVFLLSKEEWLSLAKEAKNYDLSGSPYLLLYDFLGNDQRMKQFALDYARAHRLRIVSVNDFKERDYADVNINDAGPLEFLSLLASANCVVASSFHATAFSLILQKEFYTFNLVGHNNASRMADLISSLGLSERFNPSVETPAIDYDKVGDLLDRQIEESKKFLHQGVGTRQYLNLPY